MSSERERIGQAILDLCAGAASEPALFAQADALATACGAIMFLSGKSLEESEALINEIHDVMLDHVRKNWGSFQMADRGARH